MAFLGSRNEVGRVPNFELATTIKACNLGIIFVSCEVYEKAVCVGITMCSIEYLRIFNTCA